MTIDSWLEAATADARRRGLEALVPLLEGLAHSTRQLRAADWNDDARGDTLRPGAADLPANPPAAGPGAPR